MSTRLNKAAVCTDIHFGKKSNSKSHNEDCINFLNWFKANVKSDPEIDHIMFLGDWNENRSALNIETLNYSYQGAKILDSLGLPVFFIIGNHDLYRRHARDIHSVIPYQELKNFRLITEPTVVPEIGDGGALVCPYLFHEEYDDLKQYTDLKTWWGHFEFRGFVITGHSITMPTGPNPKDFAGPDHIFSGHFHKRQADENIIYIGNTFPMDFGDAGDNERGMTVYTHDTDDLVFTNWLECPKYIKTCISDLAMQTVELQVGARVKCIVDTTITFEQSQKLRESLIQKFKLREFSMEESVDISDAIVGFDQDVDIENIKLKGVDELVVEMLQDNIDTEHFDNQVLIDIYHGLSP